MHGFTEEIIGLISRLGDDRIGSRNVDGAEYRRSVQGGGIAGFQEDAVELGITGSSVSAYDLEVSLLSRSEIESRILRERHSSCGSGSEG